MAIELLRSRMLAKLIDLVALTIGLFRDCTEREGKSEYETGEAEWRRVSILEESPRSGILKSKSCIIF